MSIEKDLERQREDDEANKSRIESASDSLYQPGAPAIIHRQTEQHSPLDEEVVAPPRAFTPLPVKGFPTEASIKKTNVVFRRLLIAAVSFFALSLAAAAFLYFYGNNIISARNINIEIVAPPSAPSSDTFSFDVSVQNGNNSDLIKSAIVIDYPEGARYVDDSARPLVSERIEIGTLGKGQIAKKTVSARLFGEENAEKVITVHFEYQVENSNGHFSKEQEFKVLLRLSPVVLSIEALQEVNNNQEVELRARVISNSNNTLSNVALNVGYPFGFTYKESNLEVPTGARGEFQLGELRPNEEKLVTIKGTINGQSAEDKIFKFNVGTSDPEHPEKVTTSLAMYTHQMSIRGDFLASAISFYTGKNYGVLDTQLRGNISWKNTLQDPINDAKFTLKISGDLFDTAGISSQSGFYDSNKSTIEWTKSTDDNLEEIAPEQTGSLSFSIPLFSYEEAIAKRVTNPKINLAFDIEGQRITENNVTEKIRSSFTKTVPVITTLKLDAYSLYGTGPFANSGPVPPKAETKTTYTVALALSNSVNEITSGELTAKLPNYVTYEGQVSPSSDKVSWNDSTRLLRWTTGSIPARTGYGSSPRILYFKVSVTPSRTQIGDILQLVNSISFTGKDSFAATDITVTSSDVTSSTRKGADGFENGQVVE